MYKYKFIAIIVSFSILATYYLRHTTPFAFAQNISLGVYPPVIQINATPPTDIQSPFSVTNLSNSTVDVNILVRPFTSSPKDNGEPQYLSSDNALGPDKTIFSKMVIFDGQKDTNQITLAPNQKKNLELRIALPNNEPPGDYYFSITMLSKPIKIGQLSSSAVAGGISTNVLLSVGPQDTTTGFIKNFSSPLFLTSGPVPFTVLVSNTSKHFITPQGTILIKNMFGQTIGKVNLLPVNVLGSSERYLPDSDFSNIQHPTSNLSHPTAIWPENFLLGPYSATISLALSGEGPLYRRTIYFFALPIQVIIGAILAILIISLIVYRVKKQLRKPV